MKHQILIKTIKEVAIRKLNESTSKKKYRLKKGRTEAGDVADEVEINPVIDSFSASR
jgi:hypothetical protein